MSAPRALGLALDQASFPSLRQEALTIIRRALRATKGNSSQAARRLGVEPRTLRRWRAAFPEIDAPTL